MSDDRLRIGDAERAAAAADLGEHFAQGRLSVDEHEERLTTIWSARTAADLAPVFGDLPSPHATAPRWAAHPGRPATRSGLQAGLRAVGRRMPTLVGAVLGVLGVLAVLAVLVSHLPFVLVGLLVLWLVAHHHHHGFGRRRRSWRY